MKFIPALGLLFIALKLMGYIEWSWIWVLAPFWAGFAIIIVGLLFVTTVSHISDAWHKYRSNRK